MRYAQYFQKKRCGSGHIWQNRFYSCLLHDTHIKEAIRYVELNPVRAKMVQMAWNYPWSSARAHLGKEYRIIKLSDVNEAVSVHDWRGYLLEGHGEKFSEKLRRATIKNLAIGPKEFLRGLEREWGVKVILKPKGRPKKEPICSK